MPKHRQEEKERPLKGEEQHPEEEPEDEPEDDPLPTPEELRSALGDQQERNIRLLAEMENARKRMQREKQDATRFAVERVITEFLGPLDHFENALGFTAEASEEIRNWAKGFEMILAQFKDVLAERGITPFTSEGTPFDPHLHEVIEMEETDRHAEGTVTREFVKGYKVGDRVLRPAKVKVAKRTLQEDESHQTDEEKSSLKESKHESEEK
ncbi:MAG: nucleotide exchange factor GrpE [Simkaniaceae bacterium]|nr:nucleotide exchange factor GrpE [Simkaniaceae bacterium]